ncbi:TerC family protein [Petroclostridium xylanilyticum]|uniref:TerC family protein n=1 Tax=Petroclostridium xylanilyticum TaxID=1792311 RepID=UPI000B9987DE|nr:TerC family protein [Petroclostridium xylanilyticum]
MDAILAIIIGALHITLLNLVLSGDNIGVIALAIKNLPQEYAKKASLIGVTAAIFLRVIFTSAVTFIMAIQWLPIKLVGGLLLIKITWDLIKPQHEQEQEQHHVAVSNKFWGAVYSIIIADITMSLDNVLAIAGAAKGNIGLIIFGLLINIPIIFFGSQFVADLMKKYTFVIYIGGAILAHTAFGMILEDRLIVPYIPHIIGMMVPWLIAFATLLYGVYVIKKLPQAVTDANAE